MPSDCMQDSFVHQEAQNTTLTLHSMHFKAVLSMFKSPHVTEDWDPSSTVVMVNFVCQLGSVFFLDKINI